MTHDPGTADWNWKKQTLGVIQELESRIAALQAVQKQPIAIIGASCRMPGAADLESFWRLLEGGVDAIAEVPPDRWDIDAYYDPDPDAPGRMGSRWGGFVEQIDGFDPQFFGISPREAVSMDPQQRLLLECAWEALENAGIAPDRLLGSPTAVFVGLSGADYFQILERAGEESIDAYLGTGTAHSAAVGRLSYLLGLEGPNLAIDTACSSSLVAVSQACDALRWGRCDLAIAGGANALLTPDLSIAFTKARMLAADGRCKVFDAAADGYVRSEGCGLVVLKRLDDARRDGDQILAIVRGAAVNQDGRSSGLTVPNGPAQQRVIAAALEQAGVAPGEVDYLEAHGTGTSLGDPIEVHAAAAVLGEGREASRPLLIGSVKTNVGHLEAAAGIAGLIKVILAMRHGTIPRHLHFRDPSPHIPWEDLPARVVAEATPWPKVAGRSALAGVSSFGFSGTNSHVIVEAPPAPEPMPAEPDAGPYLLCLSAKSESALAELAGRYRDWLGAHPEADLADVCHTAGVGRNHFEHRAAIVAEARERARAALLDLRHGRCNPDLASGRAAAKVAWLFPGQGCLYPGMARGLYESQPAFREALDRCAAALDGELPVGLLEVLFGSGAAANGRGPLLDRTRYAQPALFAVEVGLARLYASWGLRPDVVLGHSAGEYAAACVAGVFEPEEGVRLIARRGRLMDDLPGGGKMVAVFASAERVAAALVGEPAVSLAADNGAQAVISGPMPAVEALMRRFRAEGVQCVTLTTSHAFHSALVEPILDELEALASAVDHKPARRTLITNLSGKALAGEHRLDAVYWRRQTRETVQFARGVRTMAELGCSLLVEVGPQPTLTRLATACWPVATAPTAVASLRPGANDMREIYQALAQMYVHGATPDFAALHGARRRRKVDLPTYPFQRQRYWVESTSSRPTSTMTGIDPLLGARHELAGGDRVFTARLGRAEHPWLEDHAIYGTVVVPGATFAAMALHAASLPCHLRELAFHEPMLLPDEASRPVQFRFQAPDASGRNRFEVHSRAPGADPAPWVLHASGIAEALAGPSQPPAPRPLATARAGLSCSSAEDLFARYHDLGLDLGPCLRSLVAIWRGPDEAWGELVPPEALGASQSRLPIHPAVLDACSQLIGDCLGEAPDCLYLPLEYQAVRLARMVPDRLWCHARRRSADERAQTFTFDLTFYDAEGVELGGIDGFVIKRAPREALLRGLRSPAERLVYHVRWLERPLPGPSATPVAASAGSWLVCGEGAAELGRRLSARGLPVRVEGGSAGDDRAVAGVVWMVSGDLAKGNSETVLDAARAQFRPLLDLIQGLLASGASLPGGLMLVTRRAVAIEPGDAVDPLQAATWGFGRTMALEQPQLRCRLLDVESSASPHLVDILLDQGAEPQSALREDRLLVARLLPQAHSGLLEVPDGDHALGVPTRGSLDGLRLLPIEPPEPAAGEVQVVVEAVGLNFRDVLNALGVYPGDPGDLGCEFAGVVTAVGAGVRHLECGDRVFGLSSGSLANRLNVAAAMVCRRPPNLDAAGAATVPVTFCTAQAAWDLAGLRAGEKVLIHAAAGGVGMAAIQLAQSLGAEVYATASRGKHDSLRDMGITHIYDSRSTDFADQILVDTRGAGVNVVLNSLTAPGYIAAGLRALGAGGRFVEIGKIDIWTAEEMRAARPDVAYHILALDDMMDQQPERVGAMLETLAARLAAGALHALKRRIYPLTEAPAAFRYLQQARHVGKIVLQPASTRPVRDGGYLITGGLGALGLAAAEWLAEQGARHIVLAGRRPPGRDARQHMERIRAERNCEVYAESADLSDAVAVAALVGRFGCEWPTLRGIIHAAGVLDDGIVNEQTWTRFEAVLKPKALGAWHLHEQTQGLPIDFFVLYSSVAAVLGSAGQVNYAAANAFLDGLAQHRRSLGLPALSVNWGPWGGGGMAGDAAIQARMARQGIDPLKPDLAGRALRALLHCGAAQGTVIAVDWARMSRGLADARPAFLERLLDASHPSGTSAQGGLAADLRRGPAADRRAKLVGHLQGELQQVLRLAGPPNTSVSFFEMGLDSLMAVELRNRLNEAVRLDPPLSANALFDHPTIDALVDVIIQQMGVQTPDEATDEAPRAYRARVVPAPQDRYLPFPLSDIQEAYFVGRGAGLEGGGVACYFYMEEEANGIDVARLNRAWNRLVERHDMLRAVVSADGRQRVLKAPGEYVFAVQDLGGCEPEERDAALEATRREMSHQVLDPVRWPLFDIRVTRLDRDRVRLHIGFDLLIADAASLLLLFQEWATLYEQPELALPPLELTFRDCVMAEEALRATEGYRRAQAYWWDRLATLPPAPELPLAGDPTDAGSARFGRRTGALDPGRWAELKARSVASHLTPSALLFAAYSEILAAWSKHPHFTFVLTLFNRPFDHPQLSQLVGDFTSTILLEVEGVPGSFVDRARRLQARLATDLDHSAVSGVRVLRELNRRLAPERRLIPVVFTSLLGHQPPEDGSRFGLTACNPVYGITQTPQVWLDLQAREEAGSLAFNLDAVEDHFPPGLLDDLFGAYCRLLERLSEDDAAWTDLPVLVPPEQLERRRHANATDAPVPTDLLHTLVSAQAAIRPDWPAVVSAGRCLTFAELEGWARRIGRVLRAAGAEPNQLVAVVLEKGWEQVAAVLGILHAGAAYLPLDPELPEERLRTLLEIGEVEVALTVSNLSSRLSWPESVRRICIDELPAPDADEPLLPPVQQATDLAYVIFTSGSTGTPKGVMIDHRGAVNTILDINQRFGVGPGDRVLALSSLSFDLSVYDIFGVLAAGGAIVLPNPTGRRDPSHWLDLIEREGVTHWNSVPALMRLLVEYFSGRAGATIPSLRLVMLSGDWIPVTLPDQIRSMAKQAQVISLGGATEASIWSIYYPIERVAPEWKSIPYGRPMANQTFHVLDAELDPCPEWVSGELYIGGIGLAQGYWRDEEKTRARFIRHPRTGERLYRTGDWGRYLPDGDIEFLGRDDLQVKIQGYRIELAEVESALLAHPGIGSSVVTALGDPGGERRLIAYLVPRESDHRTNGRAMTAPASEEEPLDGMIVDPARRREFRLRQHGLLPTEDGLPNVPLRRPLEGEQIHRMYLGRRSARRFGPEPLTLETVGTWLENLSQYSPPGAEFPKYRYPSAGGLYPVQAYLYVRPGRMAGLPGGAYYYHPKAHRLLKLPSTAGLAARIHAPVNRALFETSAFSLFLVGQSRAIAPLYGTLARDFCLLEAGYMGQLLLDAAAPLAIGACPIGACEEGPVRALFGLEESQILLHSLVGGALAPEVTGDAERAGNGHAPCAVPPLVATPARAVNRTPAPGSTLIEDVRAYLHDKLPAYMVPSTYVILDALPLSSNGKLDRRALPSPHRVAEPAGASSAPSADLERALSAIVHEVADGRPLSVSDNFFDAGISSLGIVRIHRGVCELVRREVGIAEIFQHPSIRLLTEFLMRGRSDRPIDAAANGHAPQPEASATPVFADHPDGCLVELRRGNRQRPGLFFLPDFTGDLSGLYPLVAALEEDYSCFGLRPYVGENSEPAHWPREWVRHYVASVLERQPQGPYLFAGYSLGGALGLELALTLLEEGHGPVAVALIDSRPQGSIHERVVAKDLPLLRLLRESSATAGSGLELLAALLGNLERAGRRGEIPVELKVSAMLQQLAAGESLPARTYSFPVLLLRAATAMPSDVPDRDQAFGWTESCRGRFEVRVVPGNHSTMLGHPHVREIAECLQSWLEKTEVRWEWGEPPSTDNGSGHHKQGTVLVGSGPYSD